MNIERRYWIINRLDSTIALRKCFGNRPISSINNFTALGGGLKDFVTTTILKPQYEKKRDDGEGRGDQKLRDVIYGRPLLKYNGMKHLKSFLIKTKKIMN